MVSLFTFSVEEPKEKPEPLPIKSNDDKELDVSEKVALLPPFMVGNQTFHNEIVDDKSKEDKASPAKFNDANLVSSICYTDEETTYHQPVLDIDMTCWLEPSSTPGHYHLAIDKALTVEQYDLLLSVLIEVGIVEEGIYKHQWKDKGATFIRPPWHKKTSESGGSQTTMAFVQYKLDNGDTVAFDPTVYSVNAMKKAVDKMNKGEPPEHFPPDSKGEGWEDIGYTTEGFVPDNQSDIYLKGDGEPTLTIIEAMISNMDKVGDILEKLATQQADTAHQVEQLKAKLLLDKLEGEKFDEPF